MKRFAAITGLFLIGLANAAFAADDATHQTEAGGGGLPQFNPEWFAGQIFWLAIAFGIMYLAFAKTILPALGSVIENRKTHVGDMMSRAEAFTAEAKATYAAYEKTMSDAGLQARQFMVDADLRSKEKANATTEAFRIRAEKQISDAEASVHTAQKQALVDLQSTIGDIAKSASKQIANIDADQGAVQSAIAEAQKRAKAA